MPILQRPVEVNEIPKRWDQEAYDSMVAYRAERAQAHDSVARRMQDRTDMGTDKLPDDGAIRAQAADGAELAMHGEELALVDRSIKAMSLLKPETRFSPTNDAINRFCRGPDAMGDADTKEHTEEEVIGGRRFQKLHVAFPSRTLTDAGGVGMIPTDTMAEVAAELEYAGGPQRMARRLSTPGSTVPQEFPRVDDTANDGRIHYMDATAATETDIPNVSAATFRAYLFDSDRIGVSNSLIMGSAVNVASFVWQMGFARQQRLQNEAFTNGTGAQVVAGRDQVAGMLTVSGEGKKSGSNATFTTADIHGLLFSLDAAFRQPSPSLISGLPGGGPPMGMGFTAWQLSSTAMETVANFTGQGQFLWAPGLSNGIPGTIRGYPAYENPDMPALAASSKSVLLGDGRRYLIRDTGGFELLRFWDSGTAATDSVVFYVRMRMDGGPLGPQAGDVKSGASKAFKHLALSA